MGYTKKNIAHENRNGDNTRVIIKYITTQTGEKGTNGEDTYNVNINPISKVFKAGPVYATAGQSDRIKFTAYRGTTQIDTLITAIDGSIEGLLSTTVNNNGTNNTYVDVSVSELLAQKNGTINFDVKINLTSDDSSTVYDASEWEEASYNLFSTKKLSYSWALANQGESLYRLDLSNENTSINCDASGNILSGAVRPTCKATLFYGISEVDDASYSMSAGSQSVSDVSINASTGELAFGNNFTFADSPLTLAVTGYHLGEPRGTSTMTVVKSLAGQRGTDGIDGADGSNGLSVYITYHDNGTDDMPSTPTGDGTTGGWHPNVTSAVNWLSQKVDASAGAGTWGAPLRITGKDGSNGGDAVSYWLNLTPNKIHVDKDGNIDYSSITAAGMMQIGQNTPVSATDCSIYYGIDTDTPTELYTEPVEITASNDNVCFKMMKGSVMVDGIENVPVLKDGATGKSAYQLLLTNNAATINADSNWNILSDAVKPTCTATLYYGGSTPSGVSYSLTLPTGVTGLTINASTGEMTFASNFNFTDKTLSIGVNAALDSSTWQQKMTVSKVAKGVNGSTPYIQDGYWYIDGSALGKAIGDSVEVQFSVDGSTNWHSSFTTGDKYMRERIGSTGTWGNPIKVVGEDGSNGADGSNGSWTSFVYKQNSWIPDTPTGDASIPSGWSDSPVVMNFIGVTPTNDASWTYDADKYTFTSNTITHSQKTYDKIHFTTYANDTSVFLTYTIGSEVNYDYGYIGKLDTSLNISKSATYLKKVSGIDTSTLTIPVSTAGEHYIDVAYTKDTSNTTLPDNITITFEQPFLWMSKATITDGSAGTWSTPIRINGDKGIQGNPAVSYWLSFSADKVKVTKDDIVDPSSITVVAYKQIGGELPVLVSTDVSAGVPTGEAVIKYVYDASVPTTIFDTSLSVDKTKDFITFALYKNNQDLTLLDGPENVPILKDGIDGSNGEDGRTGAAMRGPVNWTDQTTVRRFCNGEYNSLHPEDGEYIDIILKDSSIYYCNTSYTGSSADAWADVSINWTVTDKEYNFVATNLLMAKNAKINFLSNNELYLFDASNNITAGAAGGTGVSFWAGSSSPDDASFSVSYDGTMVAEKGTFGCTTIGEDTAFGDSLIAREETSRYGNLYTILSPRGLRVHAEGSTASGTPNTTVSIAAQEYILGDTNSAIEIDVSDGFAIEANGRIHANQYTQNNNYHTNALSMGYHDQKFAFTTAFKGMNLIFLTTTTPTVTNSNGDAYANGICIGNSFSESTSVSRITSSNYSTYELESKYIGHYAIISSGRAKLTGFAHPSYITKQADTIYLTI